MYLFTVAGRRSGSVFERSLSVVHTDIQLSAAITARPGIEVYHVVTEDDIDRALLTDLVAPCRLAFVGGEDARRLAGLYGGMWIMDSPAVEGDLAGLWSGTSGASAPNRR